jgi:hypothetical protein
MRRGSKQTRGNTPRKSTVSSGSLSADVLRTDLLHPALQVAMQKT